MDKNKKILESNLSEISQKWLRDLSEEYLYLEELDLMIAMLRIADSLDISISHKPPHQVALELSAYQQSPILDEIISNYHFREQEKYAYAHSQIWCDIEYTYDEINNIEYQDARFKIIIPLTYRAYQFFDNFKNVEKTIEDTEFFLEGFLGIILLPNGERWIFKNEKNFSFTILDESNAEVSQEAMLPYRQYLYPLYLCFAKSNLIGLDLT